jgi:methyl-accepting chemotaxis protein
MKTSGLKFKSIKTQITASVVTIITVVCVGLALIAYLTATAGLRANMDDSLREVVAQGATVVSERLNAFWLELNSLASTPTFKDGNFADRPDITGLLTKVAKARGHLSMLVADTDGNAWRNDGTTLQIGDREYFTKALQGQNAVSDPIVSKVTGKLVITIAAPIKNDQQQAIGVLVLTRDGDELSRWIADVTYGKSGKAFMINKQGTTIAHSNQELVTKMDNDFENVKNDPSLKPLVDMEKKMVAGESGIGEYQYNGVTKYMAYSPVAGIDWSVALTAPKSEVFAAMDWMRVMLIIASLIFLAIGGVISYFVARHTTIPIQHTVGCLSNVAVGDLENDVPPAFMARRDEIGKLATAAQSMTDDLREKAAVAQQIADGDLNVKLKMKSKKDILTKNLNKMVANLQQITGDINMLTEAFAVGDLKARVDAAKYGGDYQQMATGLNNTVEAVINPIIDAEQIMAKIALNDYTEAMQREKYQGDVRKLADKVNDVRDRLISLLTVAINVSKGDISGLEKFQKIGKRCANDQLMPAFIVMMQNIENVIQEVDKLATAAVNGDLRARGDAGNFEGGFARMVDGFNRTLDAIIEPVNETSVVLQEMATGNLKLEVSGNYQGDHALLAQAVNHTLNSFNEVLSEFNNAAGQVAAGAQNIADSSQVLSQAATEQAATTEEITASVTEIAAQTRQNAQNATEANNLALAAQTEATVGNEQMQKMLEAMAVINESSSNISRIIKVIDEIAFQTNILALNAAVEAARAGQYGKGFAVVAEEVRNLAARSANAAKETTDLIESSIQKVAAGSQIANETAQSLTKIVAEIAKTTTLVGDIAVASNEQASGINQINQGIGQIAQVTQSNTATSEESAAASQELAAQAELLKTMVQKFKLKEDHARLAVSELAGADERPAVKRLTIAKEDPVITPKKQLELNSAGFGKY